MKKIIFTCEHGGNDIPVTYRYLFEKAEKILNTHRGFDPGSLDLFHHLKEAGDFEISNNISRLLIELNRSLGHPRLFSEYSIHLNPEEKKKLIKDPYNKYRVKTERWIAEQIKRGHEVYHFSIHSFTEVLNGKKREADMALLYDPGKEKEKKISRMIFKNLKNENPGLIMRMNYPYKGISDGFTKYLRKRFPDNYSGLEIEVNQRFVLRNAFPSSLKNQIKASIEEAVSKL